MRERGERGAASALLAQRRALSARDSRTGRRQHFDLAHAESGRAAVTRGTGVVLCQPTAPADVRPSIACLVSTRDSLAGRLSSIRSVARASPLHLSIELRPGPRLNRAGARLSPAGETQELQPTRRGFARAAQ